MPAPSARRPRSLVFLSAFAMMASAAALDAQPRTWIEHKTVAARIGRIAWDAGRNRVVLFGGNGARIGALNDTVEWDGSRWITRSPARSPSARHSHALAYDASRGVVVLFGGSSGRRETWEWDGFDWTRRQPSNAPPGRSMQAMAYDPVRQRTVLFGGRGPGGAALGDTWEWDGTNWVARSPSSAPANRSGAAMAFDPGLGQVLLFGGTQASGSTNDTWAWDGANWTQLSPATQPAAARPSGMATDEGRGRIVLQLGDTSTWEWNGSDWSGAGTGPVSMDASLAYDGVRGEVLAFGAWFDGQSWSWDGATWRLVANEPNALDGSIAYDPNRDQVVLYGPGGGTTGQHTWEWADNRWKPIFSSNRPVGSSTSGTKLVWDGNRQTIVCLVDATAGMDVWEWDGVDWTQRPGGALRPPPSSDYQVVYDSARQRLVLLMTYTGVGAETWEWDGTRWFKRQPATIPPVWSSQGAMAYDAARQRTVLVTSLNRQVWEWDGTNWRQRSLTRTPPLAILYSGPMAYDPTRQKCVYAVPTVTIAPIQFWEWDGASWTRTQSVPLSFPRSMIHHGGRQQLMLYGGDYYDNEVWFAGTRTPLAANFGAACPGANGAPALTALGEPHVGAPGFALDIGRAAPNAAMALLLGTASAKASFGACTQWVRPATAVFATTNGQGFASFGLPIPAVLSLAGVNVYAQGAIADSGAAMGVSLTPGLRLRVGG